MKKILFMAALAVSALSASAQDILIRKGGDVENVKVLEVTPTEVKFKKAGNPNGPTFTERRSNLISVKYENGEVQKFNDGPVISGGNSGSSFTASGDMGYYAGYGTDKRFTNEISFYIADGWGLGWQLRREFNPYVAWNIVGVSYMSGFNSPADAGLLNIKLAGVRGYTPSWKWIRGYADLNMGLGLNYFTGIEWQGGYNFEEVTEVNPNFGLDFSVGVQVHKNIAVGYNLSFCAPDKGKVHMARISVLF